MKFIKLSVYCKVQRRFTKCFLNLDQFKIETIQEDDIHGGCYIYLANRFDLRVKESIDEVINLINNLQKIKEEKNEPPDSQ